MATENARTRLLNPTGAREVARRFDALATLLEVEADLARHDVDEAERNLDKAARGGAGVRIAGMLSRRDLSAALVDGATARLEGANLAFERVARAAASLRGARSALASAEMAGADPSVLASVDGFWPEGDAHALPDLDRLVTVGAAIASRAAAFKAAARAREAAEASARGQVDDLRRERAAAERQVETAERDGAFGEMADRDRMLLGIPGLPRRRRQRPLWRVAPPRFHPKDEPLARAKHARGARTFVAMLEASNPGSVAPPASPWPPTDEARRTLAVSYRYGAKMSRGNGVSWDGGSRAHLAPGGEGLDGFPNQLPLMSTIEGRTALASVPFVPVPPSASNLNMRQLFTDETWDAMTGNLVAMRGDRCCVCGATCGHLSRNGWFGDDVRQTGFRGQGSNRRIDVHEAWEFSDRGDGTGLQKLVSLLPVCTDCHMVFHLDQVKRDAVGFAERTGTDLGRCREAAIDYVLDRRAAMLEGVVECPHLAAIYLAEAESSVAAQLAAAVSRDRWVADLSGMRLLNLAGGDPILRDGADPSLVAGLAVVDGQGVRLPATSVEKRVAEVLAIAPREETFAEPETRAWASVVRA